MEYTEHADWVGQPYEGYVVNAKFSQENEAILKRIIDALSQEFGEAIFGMPTPSLHITLCDWIAPLVDYGDQDKAQLFEQVYATHDAALTAILGSEKPIDVVFSEIRVSPSTIYITGGDQGEFDRIRTKFVSQIRLLPGTKKPPQIIHSSLARFTKPLPLESVQSFIDYLKLNLIQTIDEFRLVHTSREPMLEYEVLKTYRL